MTSLVLGEFKQLVAGDNSVLVTTSMGPMSSMLFIVCTVSGMG